MSSSESDVEVGFDEENLDLFDEEEENSEISDGENFNSGKRIKGKGLIWSDAICERSDSPLSFPTYDNISKMLRQGIFLRGAVKAIVFTIISAKYRDVHISLNIVRHKMQHSLPISTVLTHTL
jgi:hypothetical protein